MLFSAFELLQLLRTTSIEVYECDEVAVRTPKRALAPTFRQLATKQQDLTFRGIQLMHAVVKADYLDRRNLFRPGLAFLLQAQDILELSSSAITLRDNLSSVFNDFSLTGLVGRVGQGLTILYAQERLGMKFAAHLQSYLATQNGSKREKAAAADFVFSRGNETFLWESKGSFTLKDNNANGIRRRLNDALARQVDPWMMRLIPAPINGYAVYSCLRESSWVPSAMFVADPPEDTSGAADTPFTPEQARRENYAAWLRAMGLYGPAARLVRDQGVEKAQSEEVSFVLHEANGRTYAFVDHSSRPYIKWSPHHTVVGLNAEVLRAISGAAQSKDGSQELHVDLDRVGQEVRALEPGDTFSIFPDGSLFGFPPSEPVGVERYAL